MNRGTNIGEATACSIGDFGDLPSWGRQGWICPKCGNVLSPDTSFCIFCAKGNSNVVAQPFTYQLGHDHINSSINSTGYHHKEEKITLSN